MEIAFNFNKKKLEQKNKDKKFKYLKKKRTFKII